MKPIEDKRLWNLAKPIISHNTPNNPASITPKSENKFRTLTIILNISFISMYTPFDQLFFVALD